MSFIKSVGFTVPLSGTDCTYLSHEATEEQEEPASKEAGPAIKPCGPVDHNDVE